MVITYILHDISKKIRSIKPYYMVLHVPAFITWTLHVHLHVLLQIILHVILHLNYMVITYILHDISKKNRSIKPGPPFPPPRTLDPPHPPPPSFALHCANALVPPSPPPFARPRGVGQAVGRAVALTAQQAHKCTLRPECTLYWPFLESTCLAVNHHARVGAQGR